MDAFLAICQGLGLALAIGLLIGVVLPPIMPAWGVVAGAAPLGVLACGVALNSAEVALWPALPVGALGAGLAAVVARDVAAGAARRTGSEAAPGAGGQPAGVTAFVVLAAVALALLSLVIEPVALVAAAALSWLALARRRRESRKHAGLRVLR